MTATAFSRRGFLHWGAGAAGLLTLPGMAFAKAGTDKRFVFVIQRGAADALDTLIPYADPAYARLRGAIAVDTSAAHRLDGSFALHPQLGEVAKLYQQQQALFVHAVASPYRERSHFDGQNVMESGGTSPHEVKDGWMNRLVCLLPKRSADAIAISPTVPLALRGSAEVSSYAPAATNRSPDDLLQRVQSLYANDAALHAMWSSAMDARSMAGPAVRPNAAETGQLAARFLSQPNGPRIAMLESNGWDTHSNQAGRLNAQFRALDAMLAALRTGLGDAWSQTTVLVATEFGRTAAANGTGGTDHGNASVAMLLGGAVQGGRIVGDWPGLAPSALYQGRDLQPTMTFASLVSSTVGPCFGLEPGKVAGVLFPRQAVVAAPQGLLRV